MNMLRELKNVRQIEGESRRRCFAEKVMDLTFWIAATGEIFGFELCYDEQGRQRALRWRKEEGYLHKRVDDGERGWLQHKATNILIHDGLFDSKRISRLFPGNSRDIDALLADSVFSKLSEYPL